MQNTMNTIREIVISKISKYPRLVNLIIYTANRLSPETVAVFDYPINQRRRWDIENPHQ
jgi:hypothetical protein